MLPEYQPWDVCKNGIAEHGRMSTEDDDEIMNIEDARVSEAIRAHGRTFRRPAHFVIDIGNDEYILFDVDGEVLDLVYQK